MVLPIISYVYDFIQFAVLLGSGLDWNVTLIRVSVIDKWPVTFVYDLYLFSKQ